LGSEVGAAGRRPLFMGREMKKGTRPTEHPPPLRHSRHRQVGARPLCLGHHFVPCIPAASPSRCCLIFGVPSSFAPGSTERWPGTSPGGFLLPRPNSAGPATASSSRIGITPPRSFFAGIGSASPSGERGDGEVGLVPRNFLPLGTDRVGLWECPLVLPRPGTQHRIRLRGHRLCHL
jgi:hypothetical protein